MDKFQLDGRKPVKSFSVESEKNNSAVGHRPSGVSGPKKTKSPWVKL